MIVKIFVIVLLPLIIMSCGPEAGDVMPAPLVVLLDKGPGGRGKTQRAPLELVLFYSNGEMRELDFTPQWSGDIYFNSDGRLAVYNGGGEPLSLDETMRCRDMSSGKETFAKADGDWVPLGFIDNGTTFVALKRESKFRLLHEGLAPGVVEGFTANGYGLKYTMYLIDGLTGETDEGRVIYDASSESMKWEERIDFMPKLACDAGLIFAALPEFPYIARNIEDDKRAAKLWAMDVHGGEAHVIDLGDRINRPALFYIVSSDGGSVFFQSQKREEAVVLNLPYYKDSLREWGSLYIWHAGESQQAGSLNGEQVKSQLGISADGAVVLYAGNEYDRVMKCPKEGTLVLYLLKRGWRGELKLPISGDVRNVSLSPCGRFVGYMVSRRGGFQLRILDTTTMKDTLLSKCGPYSRFYGFAGAGRGDIAVPLLESVLFGCLEETP